MAPTDDPPPSQAESLFGRWLARRECGESADIEELCREHPPQAEALREMCRDWERVEALRKKLGLGSVPENPKGAHGSQSPGADEPSSELLARLAGRGAAFARYRMQGEMARGGMGAILRVWDEDLQRNLAMKVILGQGAPRSGGTPPVDPRKLARFLDEAQVTGQLDHPGIVPVHELGLDAEGRIYFTMKLVKGKTLMEVFREIGRGEGGWTQTRALGLIQRVCEAMSYAHSKGVIHRDLKPSNVMVGGFGEVFVMDWGLAKVQGRKGERDIRVQAAPKDPPSEVRSVRHASSTSSQNSPLCTVEGDVLGTPAYMSPEQARGEVEAMGPHSDVYAVGAMLYHLLAGHTPYVPDGERIDHRGILRRVLAGPPAPLSEVAPHASAELAAICEKAMAREPGARYADMAALSADLSAYLELRVVQAHGGGAWAQARKWVQRNKPLAAALAAVLLSIVGGAAAFAYKAEEATQAAKDAKEQAQRADQNSQEAERNELLAQEQQHRAEAETAKVLRLSDVKVLQELESEADRLWPSYPEQIPALEAWLGQARTLVGNLPEHRATLLEMRARSAPWSDEERRLDREHHPRAAELAAVQAELSGLIARLEQGLAGEDLERAELRIAELEPKLAELEEAVQSRLTWSLGSPEEQWQHDLLSELVEGLERFAQSLLAEDAIDPTHGWSVPKRLAYARELAAGFSPAGAHARAWAGALSAIREAYPGLDLTPQMDLVPIGPDPQSHLWEFAHLMTGVPAARDADGRLILTEETGVVLVLLPAGRFWMGAQPGESAKRNYDPEALPDEAPVHEVELSAFFLSKFELTQGQWARITDSFPSAFGPGGYTTQWNSERAPFSTLHPVELVTWPDCMTWLPRAGLQLPSESQWEYGCRAGTSTVFWTGDAKESLQGAANLRDVFGKSNGAEMWDSWETWLDDGHTVHAPVGSFAANPFGLHDVHGNVSEWCLDGYVPGTYNQQGAKDPVAPSATVTRRVTRGGTCLLMARVARSSARDECSPMLAGRDTGLRPARPVAR